jgi:hypothetical protein
VEQTSWFAIAVAAAYASVRAGPQLTPLTR